MLCLWASLALRVHMTVKHLMKDLPEMTHVTAQKTPFIN